MTNNNNKKKKNLKQKEIIFTLYYLSKCFPTIKNANKLIDTNNNNNN